MKKLYYLLFLVLFLTLHLIDAEIIELKIPKKETGIYGAVACSTEGDVCNVHFDSKDVGADYVTLSSNITISPTDEKFRLEISKTKSEGKFFYNLKIFENENKETPKFTINGENAKHFFDIMFFIHGTEELKFPIKDDKGLEICPVRFDDWCNIKIDQHETEITNATFIIKNVSIQDPTDPYKDKKVTLRLTRREIIPGKYEYTFSIETESQIFQKFGTADDEKKLLEMFQKLVPIYLDNEKRNIREKNK